MFQICHVTLIDVEILADAEALSVWSRCSAVHLLRFSYIHHGRLELDFAKRYKAILHFSRFVLHGLMQAREKLRVLLVDSFSFRFSEFLQQFQWSRRFQRPRWSL